MKPRCGRKDGSWDQGPSIYKQSSKMIGVTEEGVGGCWDGPPARLMQQHVRREAQEREGV